MAQIKLDKIDLIYEINKEKRIKDIILRITNLPHIENKKIHALKNINLELNDGDRLGILGHNGAGKSSFLKLVAGIYPQTNGQINVDGKIASLFELATGFEMEATGWENIMLRGLMLGENPTTMKQKINEIAEFSELGEFLDMPVKYYSSGMFIRLAFSVSTSIKPDILLLDEVMAAGDAKFIDKAQQRMKELLDSVKILIFVSHSMDALEKFCNKCIWLDHGEIKMMGTPSEVINRYINGV